ncbi:MAG: cbb3-type cytochrome c oxidase subunit II [Opitutaceae bacterium]|nr:cbb3-type cytochrome c oxidase subunit II [Opitutaceae bacterium]
MKNGPLLFTGLFLAFLISFAGLVLGAHGQLGRLVPYHDDTEGGSFPQRVSGLAARGQAVYADLGCAACHTQQVRRPGFGSDKDRGWGERQSVARDYIHQARPQLGASRLGPDLANLGSRQKSDEALYALLHGGSATHPAYKFLFETRTIAGEPSPKAVKVAGAARGTETVPTERARALVAYLLSLSTAYDYPEAKPLAPIAKAPEAKK